MDNEDAKCPSCGYYLKYSYSNPFNENEKHFTCEYPGCEVKSVTVVLK